MRPNIDLDAYFERIGYAGNGTPTLATLRELNALHTRAIPFENLDPFLGRPLRLDPRSLQRKLVRDRRGGYCYEQNLLFSHVLKALGFEVMGLAARVLWNQPEDAITPRTHMLLGIDLDERLYLADVGFGGLTLTGPLQLKSEVEQATPLERFRVRRAGEEFLMQAKIRDTWKPLYRFGLEEHFQPDYEISSWYLSNHPESLFVNRLIAARAAQDRRYALLDNELAVHHRDGYSERRVLASVAEFRQTFEDLFDLRLPDTPVVDSAFSRLVNGKGVAA